MKKYDKQAIFSRISDLPGNFTLQRRNFAIHSNKLSEVPNCQKDNIMNSPIHMSKTRMYREIVQALLR